MNVRPAKSFVATALTGALVGVFAAVTSWGALHGGRLGSRVFAPPSPSTANLAKQPSIYLWAWERPEDLRFLKPQDGIGVAFLAETIEIVPASATKNGSGIAIHLRRQPLRVNTSTPLMAVVRIESSNDLWHRQPGGKNSAASPAHTAEQRIRIAETIARAAKLPRVSGVQIHFDASQSEQPFYAALLADVRERLPREMPLSITALASWCIGDPWIEKLPVGTIDEAVSMLFRMGPDAANVAAFVRSGNEFGPAACRGSVGLSTDEPFSRQLLHGRMQTASFASGSKRTYIFTDHAWTENEVKAALDEVEK
jgi:hypothetical protein